MNWTGALREVRTMRFEEVYGRFQRGRLSCAEAADILGMSERNFLRYRTRYEAAVPKGFTIGAWVGCRGGGCLSMWRRG